MIGGPRPGTTAPAVGGSGGAKMLASLMSGSLPASSASPLSLSGLEPEPTGVGEDEEIVVSFDSLLHAELVRGRLEASGVPARLEDAHTVGMASHLASAIGGVKVVVARSDVEAARGILATPALPAEIDVDPRPTAAVTTVDDTARWALRLALAGVVFPVVGQIGSLVFAAQALAARKELTAVGRRRLAVAIAVDFVVVTLVMAAVG